MDMQDIYVGLRVVLTERPFDSTVLQAGDTGTVIDIDTNAKKPGICFDRPIGGHECCGHCERPYGWYVYLKNLAPAEEESAEPFEIDAEVFEEMFSL